MIGIVVARCCVRIGEEVRVSRSAILLTLEKLLNASVRQGLHSRLLAICLLVLLLFAFSLSQRI
jgi:hypothetical protein